MATLQAKVTSKGQITLPKQVRESLSIRSGDRLEFKLDSSNKFEVRKQRQPGSSAGCAKKLLQTANKPLSAKQMDEAIRNRMKAKYAHLAQ